MCYSGPIFLCVHQFLPASLQVSASPKKWTVRDDLSCTSHRFSFRYRNRWEVKIWEISSALAYRKCEVLSVIFTGKDSASYHEVTVKIIIPFLDHFLLFFMILQDIPVWVHLLDHQRGHRALPGSLQTPPLQVTADHIHVLQETSDHTFFHII
jgi:hypothetical protein